MVNKRKVRRIPAAVLAAAILFGVGGVSAVAAARFLLPAQVTEKMQDEKLTKAFLGEDAVAVNETVCYEGIEVTFMGIASGKNISDGFHMADGRILEDRSYLVVSIANEDGTPMPDTSSDEYDMGAFCVSPLIQGCNPVWYNIFSMHGDAMEFVEEGVRYRLISCDNVEIFADRELYLCVTEGTFYNNAAYVYDEESGIITRNPGFTGLNALFKLPIDASRADPAAAEAYLAELEEELFPSDKESSSGENGQGEEPWEGSASMEPEKIQEMVDAAAAAVKDNDVDKWGEQANAATIDSIARPIEDTRQVCEVDAEGYFSVANQGYGIGEGRYSLSFFTGFEEGKTGMSDTMFISSSGTIDTVQVRTFTLNEDGTVTFLVYVPKEQ